MRLSRHSTIVAAICALCLAPAPPAKAQGEAGEPEFGAPRPEAAPAEPRPGATPAEPRPKAGDRGITSAPDSPQDRDAMLAELYAHLAKAPDSVSAEPIAKTIETLWTYTSSPTIGLLMNRAQKALAERRPELALKLLDAVVGLAPDYAEGWSRRAYLYYQQNDVEHAVGDLRRTLALDPNHYKALEGLARILSESGQKKSALGAYRQLLRINPHLPGAKEAADELTVEVEGRGI